eukprot:TRINITY_DN1625_c0_g1_i4.p1 TRINITY_DN1625_c0_g1~~TRINITY_DN1625_c0_g1_i4.p1  ORF type:complete len:200 (-),score=4.11 TRINITY_DN1625_c0_g1_i4:259-768(-)
MEQYNTQYNVMSKSNQHDREVKTLKKLGKGGFGTVYQVKDPATSKEYAAKLVCLDAENEGHVRTEVENMKRMKDPYLVGQIEDFKMDLADIYVILMEYFPGDSLANIIKKVPEGGSRSGCFKSAKDFNSNNMLHRDIKPANILLDVNYVAKIADYETVRILLNNRLPWT